MARPCKYCQPDSKPGKVYREARAAGRSIGVAAKEAGMPRSSADAHDPHLHAKNAGAPPRPKVSPTASPLEQAQAQHTWLVAQQEWAASNPSISQKELAQIAGQVVSSVRLVARLSGALDVTEAQIVKSAPFARVLVALDAVFASFPNEKALREKFEAELGKVMGE